MYKTTLITYAFAALLLLQPLSIATAGVESGLSPEQARAIAKEAYIYANPLVDSYRIMYGYFADRDNPEFKAPWNEIKNIPRVYTPDDKSVQTPNSDTPYSWMGLDLRHEPMVFTVPPVEEDRYFNIQLIDLYTHNFEFIGSRTTGNDGGTFIIAGPGWKGKVPKGISKVIRSETELVLAVYRTQLFKPDDMENVKKIQAGYKVQTLSEYLGRIAPKPGPPIDFIAPLTADELKASLEVFNQLNFVLGFSPTHPSERKLMARFARIGIGAGKAFDASRLSPEMKAAIGQGIGDAWGEFLSLKQKLDAGEIELSSSDVFGTREHLQNNYLYRMAGAVLGIWGLTAEEAIYPSYYVDADGQKLDGAHRYTIRFAPGQLPPVRAFWSLTMYELPASLLVTNPLDRYLLNSPMLPQFKRDADGGITFYIQHESPGTDKEANWLPSPKGPFSTVMRLYWPKAEALDGTWELPQLQRVR